MKYQFSKPITTISIPVINANIADGYIATAIPLDFKGRVLKWEYVVTDAVTTASKLSTLNLEIGTTNLTGGAIALTSAGMTPLGKVIAGAAITGNNGFNAGSTLSVKASSTTTFIEGEGVLVITLQKEIL